MEYFYLLDFIMISVGVLMSVAFFTLLERKLMALTHYREGPNKVLISGASQPLADALKLLTKEISKFSMTKVFLFYSGPTTALCGLLLSWGWVEISFQGLTGTLKILFILMIMGLVSYSVLLMSWGSNSKYSTMGGLRSVAQIMSYEVCLFLFIMVEGGLASSMDFNSMKEVQLGFWFMVFSVPTFLFWVTLCMAESNRTPFDMSEGESEIVSGFNIEYSGGMFAFIFITEYGMIILLSSVTSLIFMGGELTLHKVLLMCFVYVWVRVSLPRLRYDNLMSMSWKMALPYSLALLTLSFWLILH